MEEYIETIVRYQCLGRDASVSYKRVLQAILDRIYREGLIPWQIHGTGSACEGLPREVCNDVDYMLIHKDYPVVVHQQPDVAPPQGFLTYDINPSNPAYLTLRTVPGVEYNPWIQYISKHSGNHGDFSSSRFVTNVFYGDARIQETHGPAGVGMIDSARPEIGTVDRVPCLSSLSWPPCASEFLTRPRHHGWPPQSLIDKIQQAGCHVVPVGHPQSENKDIEWRWSFSVAEKDLIHDVNDKMYMVKFVLKLLKNNHWKDINPEGSTIFCSYFIKTACLWVGEETDQSNISMMDLCRKAIDWLVTCYRTHKLPHYFIPGQNLIGQLDPDMCNQAVQWLERMKTNLIIYILSIQRSPDIEELCNKLMHKLLTPSIDDDAEIFLSNKMKQIESGGHLHIYKYRTSIAGQCSDNASLFDVLHQQIQTGTPASEVVSIPENILLSILSDLSSIVKDGFCEMFKTFVPQILGDIFMSLSIYYKISQGKTKHAAECKIKAVHYYTQGLEMVYPDGWSDRGLGGYVRLATFYHLNGEKEKLGETLGKLRPLLKWGKDRNIFTPINIAKDHHLICLSWQRDSKIYVNIIQPFTGRIIYINPVILGYYLQARYISDGRDKNEPIKYQPSIFRAICVWCMEVISMHEGSNYIRDEIAAETGTVLVEIIDNLDPY